MIRFACDYGEGCAPEILQALTATNLEQTVGYGEDPHCEHARELIKEAIGRPDALVQFTVGGTQTNQIVIACALRPYQGVLSADTGHINIHESGAIEATGHKVVALPSPDGKITAEQVLSYVEGHYADPDHEHIVQPAMVYISQPTEGGLLYSKAELKALNRVCKEKGLYLYADGARLGYALAAGENDVSLKDMAALTDAFYIGGTKVGALFGEACVLLHPALQKDFRYMMKHQGGLLAKGRLLGIQFEQLFSNGLYGRLSSHAVAEARRVRDYFTEKGIPFFFASPTNQQFPILPDGVLVKLRESFAVTAWAKVDETHTAVRICTSWATKRENVDALFKALDALL